MTDLLVRQSTINDDTVEVTFAGDIDMGNAEAVGQALQKVINAGHTKRVAVNLSLVSFLDSSGIRVLALSHDAAADHGISFYLKDVAEMPRRVLELTGLFTRLTEQAPTEPHSSR